MKKTIVVTGGAGFIGSHLCERLAADGHRVISLDNYFTGTRDNHVPGVEYREGHTKDIEKLIPETPDLIYHLGEYARVEQSVLEPEIVEDLNTIGTAGVIEFWKKQQCKLVYAGSSTKFGNDGWDKESVPYVRTKAKNTELVRAAGEQEGLPYAITYFYNVYGPGERPGLYGTVIEAFRQMYLSGAPLTVTSPGTQSRNFTHVADIVEGIVLVGEKGQGDEYGLGSVESFSIREVAERFSADIIMLPERKASRAASLLDSKKSRELGWSPKHSLMAYIDEFVQGHARGQAQEKRVLVFSTTFYPTMGPAEHALMELVSKMPDVHFDVVCAAFSSSAKKTVPPLKNVAIHYVGNGRRTDKFLLPLLGFLKGTALCREHRYLFSWSIMASYAAVAGVFVRRAVRMPLLITLADQRIENLSFLSRVFFRTILSDADQVYAVDAEQEERAARVAGTKLARSALGTGDVFANQLRYAYAEILVTHTT